MKIRKLLEAYYNTYKVDNYYTNRSNEPVEIFVNPSLKEMNKIIKVKKNIRFAIIGKKLYVWNYYILHDTILKKMGMSRSDLGILAGILKREKGKWKFTESHIIILSINLKRKNYLKSIVNKDYKWVDKYVEFTPKWNEYKKQIEKVI